MRQQIKFSLFFLSIGFLFLLSSCEKDLYEEGINQKGLKISHANFNELLKDQKFSKAYSKVQTQKNNAAKTVMEEQYQFTIADGLANVIESGNNITYTLLINRDVDDSNSFENLIIKLDSLNQTTAYIIKYSSNNAIDVSNFNVSDSNITKLITPIIYNPNKINNSSKGTVYDCYDVTYWACDYPGHTTEGVCTHGYWMTETFCFPVDGGGDSSGDGGSLSSGSGTSIDTSGGGGTSGSTGSGSVSTPPNNCGNCNTPIETAPVLELEDTITPCSQLKILTNTTSIKFALKNLKDYHLNTNSEFGYSVSTFNNSTGIAPPSVIQASTSNPHGIELPSGGNIIGALHVHTVNGSLMFSADDFRSLCVMAYKNIKSLDYSTFFVTLTTNDGTFAIKIDDFSALLIAMKGEQYENFKNELDKEYKNEDLPHTSVAFQKVLLKVMQNNNVGVSLYKANADLLGWSKLSLDPANPNSSPVATPCE